MSHTINLNALDKKLTSLSQTEYLPYKLNISSVDAFLKIRETLTRVGRLQSDKAGKESLWQVCHIVQDSLSNNYYLVHFKHLYMLMENDNNTVFNEQDFDQMTYIASLIVKWGLATTEELIKDDEVNHKCNISIIPHARKKEVLLRKKFFVKTEKSFNS